MVDPRLRFSRDLRLTHRRDFEAVYAQKVRVASGPLVVWGVPNELGHCRLGLAISRRAGGAVARNRLRRRIREAFRLLQHDLPRMPHGYDVAVSVRPHEPGGLDLYRDALERGIRDLDAKWKARNQNAQEQSAPGQSE